MLPGSARRLCGGSSAQDGPQAESIKCGQPKLRQVDELALGRRQQPGSGQQQRVDGSRQPQAVDRPLACGTPGPGKGEQQHQGNRRLQCRHSRRVHFGAKGDSHPGPCLGPKGKQDNAEEDQNLDETPHAAGTVAGR